METSKQNQQMIMKCSEAQQQILFNTLTRNERQSVLLDVLRKKEQVPNAAKRWLNSLLPMDQILCSDIIGYMIGFLIFDCSVGVVCSKWNSYKLQHEKDWILCCIEPKFNNYCPILATNSRGVGFHEAKKFSKKNLETIMELVDSALLLSVIMYSKVPMTKTPCIVKNHLKIEGLPFKARDEFYASTLQFSIDCKANDALFTSMQTKEPKVISFRNLYVSNEGHRWKWFYISNGQDVISFINCNFVDTGVKIEKASKVIFRNCTFGVCRFAVRSFVDIADWGNLQLCGNVFQSRSENAPSPAPICVRSDEDLNSIVKKIQFRGRIEIYQGDHRSNIYLEPSKPSSD